MKYLIAGLGNPGAEYAETRHNIGFKALDAWAQASDAVFAHKRYADYLKLKHKGRTYILIKPMTYMNRSGRAVRYWLEKEKIPLGRLLIVVDDIALPFGTIRLKQRGSDGGHNGMLDIINTLGTKNFNRLRFGIGSEFSKGRQIDYVLGEWEEFERKLLPERLDYILSAIKSFGSIGIERAMNFYNKKYSADKELERIKKKDSAKDEEKKTD